jgi:curved DNA-binding protein CbpA
VTDDPFGALGLDPGADLTDDDVRAAWRRIATAAHPDRADGGDPVRFAMAAAAYTELRTAAGRGEARADLRGGRSRRLSPGLALHTGTGERRVARLALRVAVTAVAAFLAVLAAGHGPAGPALATGALTWLAVTIGRDIGRPGDRR